MSTVTAVEPAEVAVEVVLGATLGRLFDSDDQLKEAIAGEISRGLSGLLDTLGVPGRPSVRVGAGERDSSFPPVRVVVNGQVCAYPRELLWLCHGYAWGTQPLPTVTYDEIYEWLHESSRPEPAADATRRRSVIEFVSLVCLEAVKIRPAVLFGSGQAAAYLEAMLASAEADERAALPDSELLSTALCKVLDQRLSIADRQTVYRTLKEESARARLADEMCEALIAALRPDTVQILTSPQYLKEITLADEGDGRARFMWVRQQLFEHTGVGFPRFEFAPVEGFEPGTFAFRFGHLTTAPYVGLRADEALVLMPPRALRELDIEGRGALNPLTDELCSVVKHPLPGNGERPQGVFFWNQAEYIALVLFGELRWKGGYFVDRETTRTQLARLEQVYPALAKMLKHVLSAERLTPVLRSLVVTNVSLRHLRTIAERLLDYHYRPVLPVKFVSTREREAARAGVDDPSRAALHDVLPFVRSGMKSYVASKFADSEGTLNVFTLDPEIESLLLGNTPRPEEVERILEAVRHQLNRLPVFGARPVIMTSIEASPLLWGILHAEFPKLQVVSFDELTLTMNVEILAKISLPAQ